MDNKINKKARDKFQQRITKGMIGPGSDTWGLPDEEEIISNQTPIQRYFSGILFPERDLKACPTQLALDDAEIQNQTEPTDDSDKISPAFEQSEDEDNKQEVSESEEDRVSKTNFFPTNIGLSVCLPSSISEIDLLISFGLYYQPKNKDVKIKISEEGYRSFFGEKIPFQLPFKEILRYDDGFMFLDRELKGDLGGKKPRSEEYLAFDQFNSKDNLKDSNARYFIDYLEKLTNIGRIWKRRDFKQNLTIRLKDTVKPIEIPFVSGAHPKTKVGYNVKIIQQDDRQYVKIQLVNLSEKQPANRYSNRNENLNLKSIFQAEIKLTSNNFLPYKEFASDKLMLDDEAKEIDFIYRSINSYAIGHNCSTSWNEDLAEIKTTFMPVLDIKDVTNSFNTGDKKLQHALALKNLTVWGFDQLQVIDHLIYFAQKYGDWINLQDEQNKKEKQREPGEQIIWRQKQNYKRLLDNIEILRNEEVFKAFQIANTSMYIQLIISNDVDFANTEKELSKASIENLNNLEFFKNYDAQSRMDEGKIRFIPTYRPFQLAFLLLNIEGIVYPDCDARKNIVDLIWFPTGGGKTEAYLAVTGLAITFRRMTNKKGYEGTTVIMRYTLRLLTAQQFERASKLITALEFLRKQKEFSAFLKDEPISIGLWVGMGSTPNKLKDAKSQIEEIDNECEKINRKGELIGSPQEKNTFQINSCPWCGTKLITQKANKDGKTIWVHGFRDSKNDFKIICNNIHCTCSRGIPVQVIDELLYEKPPTLLFGTVDKFAMLSWQEKAHKFFNSLDPDKLPPDLIIQDELHLLSGPLGSITGIFESIIEILATKEDGGRTPKIIASTATTRNTEHQVQRLYGNRKVNVFPPSGINYNDSFFASESESSNRRYLGFMPTGKTSVDTQLQILAHLLVARLEVFTNKITKFEINNYWTIVSYYNSLKDVGRTFNKVGDEISSFTSALQNQLLTELGSDKRELAFNYNGLSNRTKELTSRIESNKIKSVLNEIEQPFSIDMIEKSATGNTYLRGVVDLVLATNMISVGIDISRLNIMLMNGMPKNIAEYIQASSRVGRSTKGLVVSLMNPNRAREKSYFENFNNFHQAFYQSVEPLSITPFTENTIEKMLSSLIVSYVRNKVPGMARNGDVVNFRKEMLAPLKRSIKQRFSEDPHATHLFETSLDHLANDWLERIHKAGIKEYKQLLKRPSEKDVEQDWVLMQSMREIDANTFINIKEVF
ncbi:helicase domain-containing protein (plasmid) [Haliscomenobacter hydrossis DSM 1100]|uniref:Helicase domain-containing protein n=2 Tax=Haliscomenobacter TaxID=2349 RepID=F4L859_HALH1|nr:helicase domain-containing protein [Haliscomenobacter hydrossis DSM 1100]